MVQTVTITGGMHCHHIHEDMVWGLVTVVMGSFNPFKGFKPNTIVERKRPKHELCLGFHKTLQALPLLQQTLIAPLSTSCHILMKPMLKRFSFPLF